MSLDQPCPNPARWQDAGLGAPSDVSREVEHGPGLGPSEMTFSDAESYLFGQPLQFFDRLDVDGRIYLMGMAQQLGQEPVLSMLALDH
jgi:hypothetical protein